MIGNFIQKTSRWAVAFVLAMLTTASYAQFSANCQNAVMTVGPGGIVSLTPPVINGGSTVPPGGSLALAHGGTITQGTLQLDCADFGLSPVQSVGSTTVMLMVLDTLGGIVDTCSATVTAIDSLGYCAGNPGGSFSTSDTAVTDASSCNVCDGEGGVLLIDDNTGLVASGNNPYTFLWSDAVSTTSNFDGMSYRSGLCPGTYYVTITDNAGNSEVATLTIGCNGGGGGATAVAVCVPYVIVGLDPSGTAAVGYQDIDGGSTGSFDYLVSMGNFGNTLSFDCNDIGYNTVILSVIDSMGMSDTCTTTVVVVDSSGACVGLDSLIVFDTVFHSGCDTVSVSSCSGQVEFTVTLSNGNPAGTCTYAWSDGFSTTAPYRYGLCPGVYTVDVIEANTGNWEIVTVVIGTAQGCVWPGDTDDDATVSNYDLLPIALAYGESGTTRTNASLNWYAQWAYNWNPASPVAGLPNYKHIDANGDGLIDLNDLTAVLLNYNQSYYRSASVLPGSIPLFVGSTTTYEGQSISLPIHFGTPTTVAQDIYGLAFVIEYDPTKVDGNAVNVDFSNSWLGNDLLTIVKKYPALGRIEVALARKDHQNITDFGQIGTLDLTIGSNILNGSASQDIEITLDDIVVVDAANNQQGADNQQSGVVTVQLTTGIPSVTNNETFQVSVFPNPAREVITVSSENAQIESVQLYTATGQMLVQQMGIGAATTAVSLSNLPSGVYMLSISTDKGIRRERITVIR